jgi:hypothetical protein
VISCSYFFLISPGKSSKTLSASISSVTLIFISVAGRALPYLELRDSSILFDQLTCSERMTIYAANFVIHALNSSYYSVLSKISNEVTALLSSKAKEVYIDSSIFVSHL